MTWLTESEVIIGAKPSRMLGYFGPGAPTVRAWTVTIREEDIYTMARALSRNVAELKETACHGTDLSRTVSHCFLPLAGPPLAS